MLAPDAQVLTDRGRRSAHGLGRWVDPEPRHDHVWHCRDGAERGQPHPEIDIHSQVEASIEAANAPVASRRKVRRGLRQVMRANQQLLQVPRRRRWDGPDDATAGTYQQCTAAHDCRIRMRLELLRHSPQGARLEDVVRIQPTEDVPGGSGEASRERIRLAFVGPEDERHVTPRVLCQPLTRAVGGTTVQDDVLDFNIGRLQGD